MRSPSPTLRAQLVEWGFVPYGETEVADPTLGKDAAPAEATVWALVLERAPVLLLTVVERDGSEGQPLDEFADLLDHFRETASIAEARVAPAVLSADIEWGYDRADRYAYEVTIVVTKRNVQVHPSPEGFRPLTASDRQSICCELFSISTAPWFLPLWSRHLVDSGALEPEGAETGPATDEVEYEIEIEEDGLDLPYRCTGCDSEQPLPGLCGVCIGAGIEEQEADAEDEDEDEDDGLDGLDGEGLDDAPD